MSTIENLHKENLEFIKRRRNRQRVADLAGVHVNTISDLILDKRPSPSLKTVVAIEKAVATIKHNLSTF
jgi:ParB-like chromosome segregation protein Spo0J